MTANPDDMDQIHATIGDALRLVRKQLRLTQEDVAERLEISVEFYARLERGNSGPSLRTLVKMADFFDISADELLGRGSERESGYVPAVFRAPRDSPAARRLIRRFRKTSPAIQRVITEMLNTIERFEPRGDEDPGEDSSKDGQEGEDVLTICPDDMK